MTGVGVPGGGRLGVGPMSRTPLAFCVVGTLWAATLFLLAGAEFVTIFVGVYVLPAAALLLAGSTGVAGQSWEVEPRES